MIPCLMLLPASCNDELPKPLRHAQTKLSLNIDWSDCPEQDSLPDSLMLYVSNTWTKVPAWQSQTLTLRQGNKYEINAYNAPPGITVVNNTATVGTLKYNDAYIDGNAGSLFYGQTYTDTLSREIELLTLPMHQVNRLVNVAISVPGTQVSSAEATLSGVASRMNLLTLTPSGEATAWSENTTVSLANSQSNLLIPFWLMGIAGNLQQLTVKVNYQDGTSRTFSYDLSKELATTFASAGKETITLHGQIATSETGTVLNWNIYEGPDFHFNI